MGGRHAPDPYNLVGFSFGMELVAVYSYLTEELVVPRTCPHVTL